MRVVANNPELNGQNAHQAEIDPATWRNVRLRMEKPDGGELLVTLLRPSEWLESHNAEPGNTIRLTFVELGIDGPADVLAVDACPIIDSGTGRVVTGTFRHSAANVIDLYVTSDDQPIGTTANHPFWSETRQDFVQAGTLQPGEELRTATGASAHVRQPVPRPGSAEVFNLEVDAEHCYAVGRNGLVVHNSDNYDDGPPSAAPNRISRVGTARSGVTEVPLNELIHTHPVSRPGHSVDDVAKRISENGYRLEDAIPVLKMPDGEQILAGGNHRLAAMRQLGEITIPSRVVDWSSLSDRMKQWYRTNFPDVFGGY